MSRIVPLSLVLVLAGCGSAGYDVEPDRKPRKKGWSERGVASWYGPGFHGRRTANGEVYDMNGVSAAHKRLTFDTRVRVDNLDNGNSLVVRINDRGPFVRGRIIDLSKGAAAQLGMVEAGVADVRITVVRGDSASRSVGKSRKKVPRQRDEPKRGPVYRVQLGAFQERARADDLRRELEDAYPKVRVRSDDRWHRVVIERLGEREARKIAEELGGQGYDAFVGTCSTATPCG